MLAHALSPTELPPSRRTLVRSSAYATAGPRAPDGMAIRTAANRRSILRIAVARRQSIASPLLPSPCRSIKARCASRAKLARDGPSLVRASSVVVAPVSACAGCFGAEAASLKLFPVFLCECIRSFRLRKENAPGLGTRGHSRRLGRSGWPISLRGNQPGMKSSSLRAVPAYRAHTAVPSLSRRSRLHGWWRKESFMSSL